MMSGQLMLVSFTGRDRALIYNSVSYVPGHKPTRQEGHWWKNLTSGTARVRLHGTWYV